MRSLCGIIILALAQGAAASSCPQETPGFASRPSGNRKQVEVLFDNTLSFEAQIEWLNDVGEAKSLGLIPAHSMSSQTTFSGHAFRVRAELDAEDLLLEYRVPPVEGGMLRVPVAPCGDVEERAAEQERGKGQACPEAAPGFVSIYGGKHREVNFKSTLDFDVLIEFVDSTGQAQPAGMATARSVSTINAFEGHAFRLRSQLPTNDLLLEYRVPVATSSEDQPAKVGVHACGDVEQRVLGDIGAFQARAEEFAALVHKNEEHPCEPAGFSKVWSCVRYFEPHDIAARDPKLYGFQPGEVDPEVTYRTVDETYTDQIPRIPQIVPPDADGTRSGGYLKMTMPDSLREALLPWYAKRRNDSLQLHGPIPGGYTNVDKISMDKLPLDMFYSTHYIVVRQMQQILQWWCNMALTHTSTYGVRVYRRGSLLIDHVDRMDTHLASAVLQLSQDVDDDGGWPLELLLPHGRVAEVYLQPGELVLYEGAWLRHGRPMRFKGNEFANVFTHFKPLDWKGPSRQEPYGYHGVPKDRMTTLAEAGVVKSNHFALGQPGYGKYPAKDGGSADAADAAGRHDREL